MEIEGKLENLARIADFIGNSMKEFGLDDKKVFNIQMAVDEACANIIEHAYINKVGKIHISCFLKDEKVVVVIKDRGKSMDQASVKTPDLNASLEDRKIGGLGVYFIKTMMDEVKYEFRNGDNVLIMTKYK